MRRRDEGTRRGDKIRDEMRSRDERDEMRGTRCGETTYEGDIREDDTA